MCLRRVCFPKEARSCAFETRSKNSLFDREVFSLGKKCKGLEVKALISEKGPFFQFTAVSVNV